MKKTASELRSGDRLASPKGEHVSTVVRTDSDWIQIGQRDMYPEEERISITALQVSTGKEVKVDVSPDREFDVLD